MKLAHQIMAAAAVLALVAPPPADAQQPEKKPRIDNPGQALQEQFEDVLSEEIVEETEAVDAPELAAPGQYCKGASKKRVKRQKGTAFSACVKAQARLRSGKAATPGQACKGVSKKRVKGQKSTPFSACVKAAAQFIADEAALEEEELAEASDEIFEDEEVIEDEEILEEDETSEPEDVDGE